MLIIYKCITKPEEAYAAYTEKKLKDYHTQNDKK